MDFDKCSVNDREPDDDDNLKYDDVLNELKRNRRERDVKIFRMLLTCPKIFNETQPILLELLNVIVDNEEGFLDQKQLASQAFFKIFTTSHSIDDQNDCLHTMLTVNSPKLIIFDEEIDVTNLELFKLIIIHGYLLTSPKTILLSNNFTLSFEIIQKYCVTYRRYDFFAFKLFRIWLKKSREINFWTNNDLTIEKNLETIIFSNWDNCIREIAEINNSHIFPMYLEIMEDKYSGFMNYALKTIIEHLSWLNPTKFIIVTEICKISKEYPKISHLESNLFQCLTKSHLKHVSTKLYGILLEKMNEEQWNELMRDHVYTNAKKWESENNTGALHTLWELWMKPTLIKFRDTLIPSLWVEFCTEETMMSSSYLIKISSELGITWKHLNSKSTKDSRTHISTKEKYWTQCELTKVPQIIYVLEENFAINIFVAYCRMEDFLQKDTPDQYELCKNILYFNANSCSTQFRKGLFQNFKILFERIIKIRQQNEKKFVKWLHHFILDCFEPGSCYQRKIIGLKIYEIILMYTNGLSNEFGVRVKQKKNLQDGILLREEMKNEGTWEVDNTLSLFILLRLCLDPIDEIREHSFIIITNYFNINNLTDDQLKILTLKAKQMNKSSKFYEIASGVKLTLLVNKHSSTLLHTQFHKILLENARTSLALIKTDLLSALTKGTEFNASLTTLLEIEFQELLKNSDTDNYFHNLLNLMEDATAFFLSALSPKSSNDVSYSSSFAEMGIAIEETIKTSTVNYEFDENIISPAHQIVISCIWLALKILCNLAAKISTQINSYNVVERSVDLIVSVLMKCRHKGAIEAAGVALGVSVRNLADKKNYHSLIDNYLDKLLSLNSNDKINLTRRGAGLSIMFHRMISNDDKKTRWLLRKAMDKLMGLLRDPGMQFNFDFDSNQDCVCARQLHFLRTIVADKTLFPHLVVYVEEISIICFKYLQSLEWAIRNASLQLLGALIPRLVGQSFDSQLDFGNGYSINHFYTHYPILAAFILERIKDQSAFNIDSNIVPIITLISKMSVGGCDLTDYSSEKYIVELKNAIYKLFHHSVDHVRYAAAKAYAALTPIRKISQELFDMKTKNFTNTSRNFIHGHFMAQICLYLSAQRENIWSDNFPDNNFNIAMVKKAREFQLKRLELMCRYRWFNEGKLDEKFCNIIEATFLQSLNMPLFLSHLNSDVSHRIITISQFMTIIKCESTKNTIGVSEFIDQLFKLDIFTISKFNVDFIIDYYNRYIKSSCMDVRHYAIKYLHREIIEQRVETSNFRSLLNLLFGNLFDIPMDNLNESIIIAICEVIIVILNHREFWCTDREKMWKFIKLYNIQISHRMEKSKDFKNKKLHEVFCKIILLIAHTTGQQKSAYLFAVNDYIKQLINEGDEKERIAAIDLAIDLYSFGVRPYYDPFFVCTIGFIIALLSDENDEVRRVAYEKIRGKHLLNYPTDLNFYEPMEYLLTYKHMVYDRKYEAPKNMQLIFHNIILELAKECCTMSLKINSEWMLKTREDKMKSKSELESPFDEDETHREVTKNFNIYCHFLITSNSPDESLYSSDYFLIISGYCFYKDYITHSTNKRSIMDLSHVLDFKVADYLHYKAVYYENLKLKRYRRKINIQ